MRVTLLFLLLFISQRGSAQSFAKEYLQVIGQAGIGGLIETNDSGFIFTYNIIQNNKSQIFIVKLNSIGDTTWTTIIDGGDSSICQAWDIINVDSNYLLTGFWKSNTPADSTTGISLIKLNYFGNVLWNKVITNVNGQPFVGVQIIKSNTNDFIISSNECVLKMDSAGNFLWGWQYPMQNYGAYYQLSETVDKGLVHTGCTLNADATVVFKTDSNGILIWRKIFSGTGGANNVIQGNGNNILMSTREGIFYLDSIGDLIWYRWMIVFPLSPSMILRSKNGNYYAAGERAPGLGNAIVEFDSAGNFIWGRQLTHLGTRYPHSFCETFNGGFAMESDVAIIKTDSVFAVSCDTTNLIALNTVLTYSGTISTDTSLVQTPQYFNVFTPQTWTIKHGCQVIDLCSTTRVYETENENVQLIYPNPSTGKINVKGAISKMIIYNLTGNVWNEFSKGTSESTIDLSDYSRGMYFCKIFFEDGKMQTVKIVLQ